MSRRTLSFRLISSAAAILILAAGCSDQAPTSAQLDAGYQAVALPFDGPTPSFNRSGGVRQIIGPEGGEILAGRVGIKFPAGALAEPTAITVSPSTRSLAVTFGPHGIQFPAGSEPTVTFSYQGVTNVAERGLMVLYVSDTGTVLEKLATTVNSESKSVTAKLQHFSAYTVALP